MEEQLISFEVSKLAKEKGFNEPCRYVLDIPDNNIMDITDMGFGKDKNSDIEQYNRVTVPTQSILQKWLRETHNMFVVVTAEFYGDGINHNVQVFTYDPSNQEDDYYDNSKCTMMYGDDGQFNTYEQALEFGLEKALKLIN